MRRAGQAGTDGPAGAVEPAVLVSVALGGVLGAEARHAVGLLLPHDPGSFPWATLLVNVSGCLLLGALMAGLSTVPVAPRLARPFLGVGVLGGYTTFSAYALEARGLVAAGRAGLALGYVAATLVAAVVAVWAGTAAVARLRQRAHP